MTLWNKLRGYLSKEVLSLPDNVCPYSNAATVEAHTSEI
jgi:hypothetical protein